MKKFFSALSSFRLFTLLKSGPVSRQFSAQSTSFFRRAVFALLFATALVSFSSAVVADGDKNTEPSILNINTADAETIATLLEGIGAVRAQAIVGYRLKHGDFLHIDELQDVPGIGEKTFERIKSKLSVTSSSSPGTDSEAATAQLVGSVSD